MDSMDLGCLAIIGLLVAVPAGGLVIYLWHLKQVNRQLAEAFAGYRARLEELKQHPTDSNLREAALQWGRHYSNLTRSNRGVTVYDEVALANDIAAACAGATQAVGSAHAGSAPPSLEQRLERLKALRDTGTIEDHEYQDRRARLLDEV